jgi:two-component system LytT family response regulator
VPLSALWLLIWVKLGERMEMETDKIVELPREVLSKQFGKDDFILVADRAKAFLVRARDIIMLEADGNDTVVYLLGKEVMVRGSISKIEAELDSSIFFRADRSHIINLELVKKFEVAQSNRFVFTMEGGRQITLSRKQNSLFKREKRL